MAEPTNRDKVWKAALTVALRKGDAAKPEHIADLAGVSERMTRQCLLVMSESGWLDRRALPDGTVQYIAPSDEEWLAD
jgi:hypothetical protein